MNERRSRGLRFFYLYYWKVAAPVMGVVVGGVLIWALITAGIPIIFSVIGGVLIAAVTLWWLRFIGRLWNKYILPAMVEQGRLKPPEGMPAPTKGGWIVYRMLTLFGMAFLLYYFTGWGYRLLGAWGVILGIILWLLFLGAWVLTLRRARRSGP